MYTFEFMYSGNKPQVFQHIVKVVYFDGLEECIVEGEDISSYKFPVNVNMSLYSEKSNYFTSPNNLQAISITKEF